MDKNLKTALITSAFYFIFYNLISYTFSKTLKLPISIISTVIFFVVYLLLLKFLNKKRS